MSEGRVRIKVRLSGKLALEVGDQCVGGGSDVVRLTVSGKPTYAGEKIGLTDIRVDEVSNEAYRVLLQQFLESAIPVPCRSTCEKVYSASFPTARRKSK